MNFQETALKDEVLVAPFGLCTVRECGARWVRETRLAALFDGRFQILATVDEHLTRVVGIRFERETASAGARTRRRRRRRRRRRSGAAPTLDDATCPRRPLVARIGFARLRVVMTLEETALEDEVLVAPFGLCTVRECGARWVRETRLAALFDGRFQILATVDEHLTRVVGIGFETKAARGSSCAGRRRRWWRRRRRRSGAAPTLDDATRPRRPRLTLVRLAS